MQEGFGLEIPETLEEACDPGRAALLVYDMQVGVLQQVPERDHVVEAVGRVSGAELDVRHGPAKAGEMPAVIVDPSRARAAGWSPRLSFEEGLAAVWDEWSRADVEAIAAGAPAAPITAGGGA